MKTSEERFFDKVNAKNPPCWLWTGSTYRRGYGHFRMKVNGKWTMYKAHRFSYEHFIGEIPKDLLVLHSCDVPSCVNPAHLRVGTHKENSQDKTLRNRHNFGNNPKHHLLSREFAETVRNYASSNPKVKQILISQMYGASPAQISRILNNKIWKRG